jgi:hypothetical protein
MQHHEKFFAKEEAMTARVRSFARAAAWSVLVSLVATTALWGQASPEGYRNAYRGFRLSDPALERDANTAGESLGARADRVAAEAAKYANERRVFLDRFAQENDQKLPWVEISTEILPPLTTGAAAYVAIEAAIVRRAIDVLGNDPDPALKQVRMVEERENVALNGLTSALAARLRAADDVDRATGALEQARRRAADLNRTFAANLKKVNEDTAAEATAWTEYYRRLSDGARARSATPPASSISTLPADPAPRTAPSGAPLPLVRYTGDWVFPTGGMSFGAKPEFVDLVVRESNGQCTGRMLAKFIVPAGSTGDPLMRFEFSGEFKNSKSQTFVLETSDGAKGFIELIPGAAFNLLEINVEITNPKAGKIRKANAVLVKK